MNDISIINFIRIAVMILFGVPCIRWLSHISKLFFSRRFSQHVGVLIGRVVFYSGLIFIGIIVLHECGFNVTALLGAAGLFGVALGFASQTSISNIVSGFFLVLERPFSIGDTIKSDEVMGVVESIDLLSVSIRTLDNKLVRLPNETVLKQYVTNLTYYATRRIDCVLSTSYSDDCEQVKQQIRAVVASNPLFLSDPAPVIMMHKVGQHDYDTEIRQFFSVRVWIARSHFPSAPAVLMQQLKEQFEKNKQIITIVHVN